MNEDQLYKCPNCGKITTIDEMEGDFIDGGDYDECYSNYICPNCKTWFTDIDDWIKIK